MLLSWWASLETLKISNLDGPSAFFSINDVGFPNLQEIMVATQEEITFAKISNFIRRAPNIKKIDIRYGKFSLTADEQARLLTEFSGIQFSLVGDTDPQDPR